MLDSNRYIIYENANVKVCYYQVMISNGLFEETNEQLIFLKYFTSMFKIFCIQSSMRNHFDEMNSVIKCLSTIHDIYHHVMWTSAIKVNRKNKTAHFNIYFSFWEVYNNNKTKNENTMHVRSIAHVNLLAYVPVGARAIVRVSGRSMLLPSNRSLEGNFCSWKFVLLLFPVRVVTS